MTNPIEQLETMRHLNENWDGYGAAAPQGRVIDLAQGFVDLFGAMLTRSPSAPPDFHVSPTRVGGVLIEWDADTVEHEVDLGPDGSISFLHHDKITGSIATRTFSAMVEPGLLHELRQLAA